MTELAGFDTSGAKEKIRTRWPHVPANQAGRQQSSRGDGNANLSRVSSSFSQAIDMSTQDGYIDARLNGIESKLDAKVDGVRESVARMQKGFDDAEARFERTSERHSAEVALLTQRVNDTAEGIKRHVTATAWAIGAVLVTTLAIIVGVMSYWISEQGSYAKSYGETQVEIQQAADERAEFREAVKSIQATQQSILERLPERAAQNAAE